MIKKELIVMLLAGAQGSHLGVLPSKVAKPVISFGGKYRIIDFPLSNFVSLNDLPKMVHCSPEKGLTAISTRSLSKA